MKDFAGKVAFITGGASGAGFGQAKVFSKAGCKIVIADIRQEPLDEALAYFRAQNAPAHAIRLDITDRAAYACAADEVEKVFGEPPQLLFNTAGVNSFGPVENSTYDDYDWLMGVNFWGVANGMQTFVPRMIKAGKGGYVVSTASVGGFQGSAVASIYSAAKAAVISLMESYRAGLAKYGIEVSVLCPANIRSNIAEAVKTRPAHLANTGYNESEEAIASLHSIYSHGMDPVVLAERTKQAMEAGKLYIIPYPEERERLAQHFREIVDSIPPIESDPEGAKERTEALMNWAKDRGSIFSRGREG